MTELVKTLSIGILFALYAVTGAAAQGSYSDTLHLKVFFKRGSSELDVSYNNNTSRLIAFRDAVRAYQNTPGCQFDEIVIRAGASPDGNTASNQELSEGRAQTLLRYLSQNLSVPADQFELFPVGEDWDGLARAVGKLQQPWAPDALNIIVNTPIWVKDARGNIVDSRKNRLKTLSGGDAWFYLRDNVFEDVCSVGTAEAIIHRTPTTTNSTGGRQLEKYFGSLQDSTKTILEIQFRLDSTRVDLDYAGNRERLDEFLDTFEKEYGRFNPVTLQMDIYAGASPEGTAEHNFWLGAERGASIRRLLWQKLGDRVGTIEVHNQAARWQDLYESIASSDEPWREEVLSILSLPPSDNPKALDHRELKLRSLRGGTVWPVLLSKYLAPLRSGGSAGAGGKTGGSSIVLSVHPERDTIYIKESRRDTVFVIQQTPVCPDAGAVPKARKERVPADKTPAWAVKTNLLMWGVVAPNVQVEIPLGRWNRWSLEWEYMHPWFIWNNNAQASQILDMGLELRLYLGNRDYHRWLDGWHLGIAVAGGKYDWEWKQHEGWQGEFINAYFNVGYQHRFGKHWAVDAGLGLGVIPSRYRHYYGGSVYPENHLEPWDEHLIWHDTGSFVFPAATHVNISITYLFNNRPFRFRDMSRKKAQEYNDAYSDHQAHKQALKRQKEELREQKAVAREQKRESKQKKSRKQQ